MGPRAFRAEITPGNTIIMDPCHYAFVQTHRMYTKSDLYYKLWTVSNYNVSIWTHQL